MTPAHKKLAEKRAKQHYIPQAEKDVLYIAGAYDPVLLRAHELMVRAKLHKENYDLFKDDWSWNRAQESE